MHLRQAVSERAAPVCSLLPRFARARLVVTSILSPNRARATASAASRKRIINLSIYRECIRFYLRRDGITFSKDRCSFAIFRHLSLYTVRCSGTGLAFTVDPASGGEFQSSTALRPLFRQRTMASILVSVHAALLYRCTTPFGQRHVRALVLKTAEDPWFDLDEQPHVPFRSRHVSLTRHSVNIEHADSTTTMDLWSLRA